MTGFEPVTSSLPRKCSTPELHERKYLEQYVNWSGRRDSNPRPLAWKANALPTELLPQESPITGTSSSDEEKVVGGEGFEPP